MKKTIKVNGVELLNVKGRVTEGLQRAMECVEFSAQNWSDYYTKKYVDGDITLTEAMRGIAKRADEIRERLVVFYYATSENTTYVTADEIYDAMSSGIE